MGHVRCREHGCLCCWRCDRCPKCEPETGRLRKGEYCSRCVAYMRLIGYVWSDYYGDYVPPADAAKHRPGQVPSIYIVPEPLEAWR